MQPQAILLAAKKCAGTGDLRKALDVVRQAIELYEADLRRKSLDPLSPLTHQSTPSLPIATKGPRITLRHVNQVTTASLGAASSGSEKIRGLTFIQKAMLVAALLAKKKAALGTFANGSGSGSPLAKRSKATAGAIPLKTLLSEFDLLARKKLAIPVPSRMELQDIVMTLQTYSLLSRATTGKATSKPSTPKDTDSFRLELSDEAIKIGLDDPLASYDEEEGMEKGKGVKILLGIIEEQERIEKRARMLGAEGEDLADD